MVQRSDVISRRVLLFWRSAVTSVVAGDLVGLANDVVGRQRAVSCARGSIRAARRSSVGLTSSKRAYAGQQRVPSPRYSWLPIRVSLLPFVTSCGGVNTATALAHSASRERPHSSRAAIACETQRREHPPRVCIGGEGGRAVHATIPFKPTHSLSPNRTARSPDCCHHPTATSLPKTSRT